MAKKGFPGGMPGMGGMNMNKMLKQAQKMQEDMAKAQKELEEKEVEASVGGGAVTVKVNGKKELVSISIKEEVVGRERRFIWWIVLWWRAPWLPPLIPWAE